MFFDGLQAAEVLLISRHVNLFDKCITLPTVRAATRSVTLMRPKTVVKRLAAGVVVGG